MRGVKTKKGKSKRSSTSKCRATSQGQKAAKPQGPGGMSGSLGIKPIEILVSEIRVSTVYVSLRPAEFEYHTQAVARSPRPKKSPPPKIEYNTI